MNEPETVEIENPNENRHICGTNETVFSVGFTPRPWPQRDIKYRINVSGFNKLTEDAIYAAAKVFWDFIKSKIDINPILVEEDDEAHIRSVFSTIDGPSNVLAQSEVADGSQFQKNQWYDKAEAWVIAESTNQIDWLRVYAHEIIHALGLLHDSPGADALMAPTYSSKIRLPTQRDINRLIALGYKPAKIVPPQPPTDPIPGETLNLPVQVDAMIRSLKAAGYEVYKKI